MKYRDKNQDSDWAKDVPENDFRGPYEDYGWEADTSVLPEFRDPGVHLTPQERQRRERKMRQAGWPPDRQHGRMPVTGETQRYRHPRNRGDADDRSEFGNYDQFYGYTQPHGSIREDYRGERRSRVVQGPYSGRGPQGYHRSDDRIFEEVCQRLTDHGQIDARKINVTVQNGEVTLTGSVDNRRTKRMVEDTIDTISGVQDVHNRLTVEPDTRQGR